MFKLVGKELFDIGKHKCVINIEAASGFSYEYSLEINGKSYEKFCENQSKVLQAWVFKIKDKGSFLFCDLLAKAHLITKGFDFI